MQRNRTMIKKTMLAVLILTAGQVYAQDTARKINQFSLQQALDYAKQHAVQVKNALLDVKIQHQVNRDVTSIALPQITGSGSVNEYLDIPITVVPAEAFGGPAGSFQKIPFGTRWTANAGVNFRQMLFDGQVFIALKARNGTMELSRKVEELTEETIRANVYKIYYQLVVSKTQVQLLDANISRLEKLKHDMQVMYDNGFTEKLDINKMTVQLANLQTEKFKVTNMISNGYLGLKTLLGMPIKDSLALTDTLSDTQIKDGALAISDMKYSDRRDFQISEITNKLNALNVRRYKLSQYPTLSFVGNYSKQAQRNEFDFFKKGDWFTTTYIGLQLNVPIFYGFSYRAKTEKARLELQKSRNETEALKISIDNEVQTASNNFATAIASMDYQKENMTLAEEVYSQTKKKYEIGTGSTTEINTAEVDLKTAQTNYITALYDAIIARVDFLKATGKL
ncbi:MAG: TolC family protein [Ferruginibacter sp.]